MYRDQYYQAKAQLDQSMNNIDKLEPVYPEQYSNIYLVEKQINDLIFFWSKLRIDESKYDIVEIGQVTFEENSRMDTIKYSITEILGKENAKLIQSEAENNKILSYFSWASPTGGILFQLLIATLICLIIIEFQKRKKIQSELQRTILKEKQINEMKSRFVSMASHEFRTPLTAILSSTQLAASYSETDDQYKREKHYERITSAVYSLTEILEDLLSVEQLEIGKINLNVTEFNLEEFIRTLIDNLRPILKSGQQIIYEHSGTPTLVLDAKILKHILINLFSNAIKFSKENDTIHVMSYRNFDLAKITVKDNGIGIPKNEMQYLFDIFHRASNSQNIEGTGLGST